MSRPPNQQKNWWAGTDVTVVLRTVIVDVLVPKIYIQENKNVIGRKETLICVAKDVSCLSLTEFKVICDWNFNDFCLF